MPTQIKVHYGEDPKNQGFFWVESEQKRLEAHSVRRNAPQDFESTYQCRPGQRVGVVFLDSDLSFHYKPPIGLMLGPQYVPEVAQFLACGHMVIQAWDTAFSTSSQSAFSVCVTALLISCAEYHCGEDPNIIGQCDNHFDVLILDVFRKRMDFAELTPAMRSQHIAWRSQEMVIEKKASGFDAISVLASAGMPIVPMPAKESKRARALNTVGLKTAGSVQGWFRQGRVLTPDPQIYPVPWFEPWRAEMRDFSGNDDTFSDQVDATVHLVTRAIVLGAGAVLLPSGWSPERSALPQIAIDPLSSIRQSDPEADPRAILLASIGSLPDFSEHPFYGMCGHCTFFKQNRCSCIGSLYNSRVMTPFDSCAQYEMPGSNLGSPITSLLPDGRLRV